MSVRSNPLNNSSMPPRRKAAKITIRPYSKPPSLPDNYYEQTVGPLLQGTLDILSPTATSSSLMSLQNAYQAVVTLVRHQYGPRLYQDWMQQSLQAAVTTVLAPPHNNSSSSSSSQPLLQQLPSKFRQFTDYLQVCKHVFLPLDRTHVWNPVTHTAVAVTAATNNNNSNNAVAAAAATTSTVQSLWTAGLAQFRARCCELNLETALYQEWFQALLDDWHSSSSTTTTLPPSSSSGHYPVILDRRQDLRAVWYMWQDLGLLSSPSPLPLQRDLQDHWTARGAAQWEQIMMGRNDDDDTNHQAAAARLFLQVCYRQHAHVTQWPWLPVPWLWHILDVCCTAPVLNAHKLLHPRHLHPVLQMLLFHPAAATNNNSSNSNDTTTSDAAATLGPIQQLWMLAGRLPTGQADVAAAICQFAKTEGIQRLQQQQQPDSTKTAVTAAVNNKNQTAAVAELLQLQECLTAMIQTLPGGSDYIILKSVWEDVVNTKDSLAEGLAKFLDQILRSNKKMDEYQNKSTGPEDAWLSRIISGLFVPLQSKDVFEAFYKRDLAKRLLWNRVVSMDVEKQVCSLLKAECGAGYTSKMEGMFQDIDLSRESMMVYKQSLAASAADGRPNTNVEMEVQILTTGYWPVYPQYPNLHLPNDLKLLQQHFDAHYNKKCHGRRITWQYALGHVIVRATGFKNNKSYYELVVNLCQALVLVQFVSAETVWTLPSLMQVVGLEDRDEMERILQSLALGKEGTRILRKIEYHDDSSEPQPAGKKKKIRMTVHDKDQFMIQQNFTSNQRRIRIQNIMMKETVEEREKTVESVSRDRLYLIDAVLVRILKSRKTVTHQNLLAGVLEQVKFPATAADVKQRIESLIEREYMERDANDRSRYNYLA